MTAENTRWGLSKKTLKCFDLSFNETDFESCSYVNLATEDDVTNAIQLCAYKGISSKGFDKPGIYMYNDGYNKYNSWVNLEAILAGIRGGTSNDK